MSDSPLPSWPSSEEVEALVVRVIGDRVDPLRAHLVTIGLGLGILAERVPRPQVLDELASRVDAVAARVEELAAREAEARELSDDGLRKALAVAVDHAVAKLEQARAAESARLLEQVAALVARTEADAQRRDAEVQAATATALTSQVEPLVACLVEACDNLSHEAGRIEAMARGHTGEARAIEERVAGLFVEVAERAESAVDHSRARIAEGQVALGKRFDAVVDELMTAVSTAADQLEARLTEAAEGLRAAGGHQNGALLDTVNRSSQQLADGLAELRSAVEASSTEAEARNAEAERRAESVAERLEALRTTVESVRHDPRLEALVVEQVAAREVHLAAIQAVSGRIDEIGPVVARALLPEVERATRAANAAEEAVAALRPDDLRSAVGDAVDDIRSTASRLDETVARLVDQIGQCLVAIGESQADMRAKLAGLSGTTLEDLRASQASLRKTVQEGTHKAELAALDVRGLRDRLAPHLVALAEATSRRADADQAGFDAVLARLDQLLAGRQK